MDLLGAPYVQRNWELQFLGQGNQNQMKVHLFEKGLTDLVPESLVRTHYNQFYEQNALQNAHALNILLVLSLFNQKNLYV